MNPNLFDDRTAREDEDVSLPTKEEVEAVNLAVQAREEGRPGVRKSAADAILDAVSGRRQVRKDVTKCPLCGSDTKIRGNSVGVQTITRRCKNASCKNEYPVGGQKMRIDVPPPPIDPLIQGGPYLNGPTRGNTGAPAIDHEQPLHRRLSETIRRMNDVE